MNNINTTYFFETLSLSGDFSLNKIIFSYVFSLFGSQENVKEKIVEICNSKPNP